MIVAIVAVVLTFSVGIAIWAGRAHRGGEISEFLVGGRSFPAWLVYFLAVGEVYSIGTLLGFPSGIYFLAPAGLARRPQARRDDGPGHHRPALRQPHRRTRHLHHDADLSDPLGPASCCGLSGR